MTLIDRLYRSSSAACACALGVIACSSGGGEPVSGDVNGRGPSPAPTAPAAASLVESTVAQTRVAEIRARFSQTIRDPLTGKTTRHAVIPSGVATAFERASSGRIRAVVARSARRGLTKPAHLELPSRAMDPVSVVDEATEVGVSFALVRARDVAFETAGGFAIYRNALGPGGDIVHRPRVDGTEDFVVFPERPAAEEIRYRVDISHVAGLRMVTNVLEMLDAKGTPRLRMAAPYIVDANGDRHGARVEVSGCNYDTNPKGPWGRPVTAPNASSCDVRIAWSGAKAAYPVMVDPAWVTTGSMTFARYAHGAALVGTPARVIAVGGAVLNGTSFEAELYDVTSETWSPTGSAATYTYGDGTVLQSGKVLFLRHGGVSQVYDPGNGQFTLTVNADPCTAGFTPMQALLNSGKVLIAGGYDFCVTGTDIATAALYDPSSNSFVPTGSMGTPRQGAAAVKLTSGKVLIAGGHNNGVWEKTAELYDPVAGTFAPVSSQMASGRFRVGGALLPSGKVLIVSHFDPTAELYDPSDGSFTLTGPLSAATGYDKHPTLTVLPGGGALFAHESSAELYDWTSGKFLFTGALPEFHDQNTATLLPGGKVLIAGGYDATYSGGTANCALFSQAPAGASCVAKGASGECESLLCNGGTCCQGACADPCTTCESGTGACLSVVGTDDADSCTSNLTCDIAGACKAKAGVSCSSAAECASGSCADGFCCDAACTGACQQCFKTPGSCLPVKNADDPGSCTAPNTCDANGACKKRPGQTCSAPGQCASGFCVDNVCCSTACNSPCQACSAAGTCLPVVGKDDVPQCIGNQTCSAGGGCKAAIGQTCSLPSDCASGFCADGVCCDSACTGSPCMACSAAATGDLDGKCANVKDGDDPHNDCSDGLASGGRDCSSNGSCNGVGGCKPYPVGAPCAPPACNGTTAVFQARTCDSLNACGGGGTSVPCPSGYTCIGGACLSSCSSNSDCTAPYICDNTQCKLPLGSACTSSGQCVGAICSPDGVCCDAQCDKLCEGCKLATTGVASGTCAPLNKGTDPDDECPDEGASSCTRDGMCDGAGKCEVYGTTTVCVSASCASATSEFVSDTCNGDPGAPACVDNGTKPCATGYACVGSGCNTSCAADADCATGYICSSSKCLLAIGAQCSGNTACASGYCVEGVCCNEACMGACRACTAAKKGSGTNGVCGNIAADTDPDNECLVDSGFPNNCGADGQCDGNGACRAIAKSTVACGVTQCVNGAVTGALCDGSTSGPNSCQQSTAGISCAPYNCLNGECGKSCQVDADCSTDAYCTSAKTCAFKRNSPENCGAPKECKSGFCADSVCCDKACNGQCESCGEAANAGTCTTITGAPRAPRLGCAGVGTCAGTCDGTNAATCTYNGSTVTCTPGSCTNGMATSASVCDSAGSCTPTNQNGCGAYKCDTAGCKTRCAGVGDCASGAWCQNGACVPLIGGDGGVGGATSTGGATGSSGAAGSTGTAGAGGATGAGASAGSGAAGSSGRTGGGAVGGSSGSGASDAGTSKAGEGTTFAEPTPAQDSGCGCRTAQSGPRVPVGAALSALMLVSAMRRRSRITARSSRNPASREISK